MLSLSGQPHSTIQAVPLPWKFRQVNSRGRIRMNAYTSATASHTEPRKRVHTSVTFSGRRDGTMRVTKRNITSKTLSTSELSTSQSFQAAPSEEENIHFTCDDDHMLMDDDLGHDETLPHKRKCPLLGWMSERDTYLAELIRLDGRGEHVSSICAGCHALALSRCVDCDDLQLYCHECTVSNHVRSPTHRIQVLMCSCCTTSKY